MRRFGLPRREFLAVIDGMETDAAPTVRMRTLDDLLGYCRKVRRRGRRVVGPCVRRAPASRARIAETLGNALQLTNILRDVKEDAALERLYVPLEMLGRRGVVEEPSNAVLGHPGFGDACADLAGLARGYYAEADRLIAELGPRKIRPAVIMMAVYRDILDRLEDRGWQGAHDPIRLTRARKMWLALRSGFL